MKVCVGVDVGGTSIKFGLFTNNQDSGLQLLDKWEIPTNTSDAGSHIIEEIASSIKAKIADNKLLPENLDGIGVGVPGPVVDRSIVRSCVNLGWGMLDVRKALREALGETGEFAHINIVVENDANVAALGEYTIVSTRKAYRSLVMMTLGTGVGGGIVIDGQIMSGMNGAAGEFGHMPVLYDETEYCNCGKKGCLEQIASATGMVRLAGRRVPKDTIDRWSAGDSKQLTAKDIFDAMANGDSQAEAVVDEACSYIATALANITCVINPEVIVIGGGVSRAGNVLIDRIKKYYNEKAFSGCKDVEIILAELLNDAGIYGAATMGVTG
ncbi:MAG: ROK family glucokinase [Lachnospiraceae bacterium]|nr:ROK family glucokinase [Lachnospiraceae bacterium]